MPFLLTLLGKRASTLRRVIYRNFLWFLSTALGTGSWDGVMENWSVGVPDSILQFSTSPLLHRSLPRPNSSFSPRVILQRFNVEAEAPIP